MRTFEKREKLTEVTIEMSDAQAATTYLFATELVQSGNVLAAALSAIDYTETREAMEVEV